MIRRADNGRTFTLPSSQVPNPELAARLRASGWKAGMAPVWVADDPFSLLPVWELVCPELKEEFGWMHAAYAASFATRSDFEPPVPEGEQLLPFQKAGVEWAVRRERSLIGDAPGLGKTVQALALANAVEARSVLVVCPAAVRLQWGQQARRWLLGDHRVQVIVSGKATLAGRSTVVVVSYDSLRNTDLFLRLREREWDLMVLDESHYIKTPRAKRTRAIIGSAKAAGLESRARRVALLTGTPLPNKLHEAWTSIRLCDPGAVDYMSFDAFKSRFAPEISVPIRGKSKRSFPIVTSANELLLQARLRATFMVRRLKEDVLTDLPPKVYDVVHLAETGALKKALRAEKMLDIDPLRLTAKDVHDKGAAIATARREMGAAKVPQAVEYCKMLLDGGIEKLVVFAYHKEVIAALATGLQDYRPAVVTGVTSGNAREEAKLSFVENPRCRVFIGQLLAAGTGIDGLQKVCDTAVFVEIDWVPGVNEQAIDRLHRHGQRGTVTAHFLVAEDSLDMRVLRAVVEKSRSHHAALDKFLLA